MSQTETGTATEFLRNNLRRSVVLVGMMGSGKSTVGRRLADILGFEFKDSDSIVEAKANLKVAEIFAQFGEPKFREAEHNTIIEVLNGPPCVLATGGGAVMNADTRAAIKGKAVSVWLKVSVEDTITRLKGDKTRPLLQTSSPEETLRALMDKRKGWYAEADITVESDGLKAEETANAVINELYEHLRHVTL